MTKLELFLKRRKIKPAHLAKECGYSRAHLLRLRNGEMEPTRKCMKAIREACSRLTQKNVRPTTLFDL
jgi:predicted transcriptional regulator